MRKNAAVTLLVAIASLACGEASAVDYALKFSGLGIARGERIVGFKLTANAAQLAAMKSIPPGWFMDIKNDPSRRASLEGNIVVGAAALDVHALDNLFVIRKEPDVPKEDSPFGVSGEVVVSKDFEHERHIVLKAKNVSWARIN